MIRARISISTLLFGMLLITIAGCGGKSKTEEPTGKSNGGSEKKAVKPSAKTPIDTAYITDDFVAAIVVHPARVLENKDVQAGLTQLGGPKDAEALFQAGVKELGFDPRTLEQSIVLIDADYVKEAPMMFLPRGGRPDPKRGSSKRSSFRREEKTDSPPRKEPDAEKKVDDCLIAAQPKEYPEGKGSIGKKSSFSKKVESKPGPQPSFIARFTKAPDQRAILKTIARGKMARGNKDYENPPALPTGTHGGKTYHIGGPLAFCFVDDKTIIGGPEQQLKKMLTAKNVASPLTKRLSTLGAEHDLIVAVAGPQFEQQLQMLKSLPVTVPEEYKNVPNLVSTTKSLAITFSLTSDPMLSVIVELGDDASAKELAQVIKDQAIPDLGQLFIEEFEGKKGDPPAIAKIIDELLVGVAVTQDGRDVVASVKRFEEANKLPQQLVASFVEAREAARRSTRKNQLKQIGLAFHNFHAEYGHFPAHNSNGDRNGKTRKEGLSWRVHLLPQLGRGDLYNRFKLDEPWDSPHNKQLIREMPDFYASPFADGHASVEGITSLHVFIGPAGSRHATPFSPGSDKKFIGIRFHDITDGTSNTLLVVDAGADKADIWTKPGGLPFDPAKDPKLTLGNVQKAGFLALYANGRVRLIPKTIAAETLKLLLGHHDGKPVPEF